MRVSCAKRRSVEACKKRWGREKTKGRGKGKRLGRNQITKESSKERKPRTEHDSMQSTNAQGCRHPLTMTRRPGEYLKTRLACAIERSEVDKPGWRVQQFVGLKGWWRCGRWQCTTAVGGLQNWTCALIGVTMTLIISTMDTVRGTVPHGY